jgi:hypothetical protein
MTLSVQISNVLRINCSYKLWIVNKTNYQSERRLQAPQTRYNTFLALTVH